MRIEIIASNLCVPTLSKRSRNSFNFAYKSTVGTTPKSCMRCCPNGLASQTNGIYFETDSRHESSQGALHTRLTSMKQRCASKFVTKLNNDFTLLPCEKCTLEPYVRSSHCDTAHRFCKKEYCLAFQVLLEVSLGSASSDFASENADRCQSARKVGRGNLI